MPIKINFSKLKPYLTFAVSLLANVLIWLWLYFFIKPAGDSVPLHYNIYFGIDEIGKGIKLYLQPLFGLIIILINILLASFVFKTNKKIVYYLGYLSIICQLGFAMALFLLIINYF